MTVVSDRIVRLQSYAWNDWMVTQAERRAILDALKGDHVLAHTNGGIGPDGMIVDSHGNLIWANFLGRSLGVARPDWTMVGNIPLPAEAGALVTNVIEHQGAYYVTEAEKGEVWKLTGLEL